MIPAAKYHCYGNDFILVEGEQVTSQALSPLAGAFCRRHTGVGADGCVFLFPHPQAHASLRIFNQDGSEAGISGNGARCAAAFLVHRKGVGEEVLLETPSGRKRFRLLQKDHWGPWTFQSDMGFPSFSPSAIPMDLPEEKESVEDFPLEVQGRTLRITALSVGNPQCVVFVEEWPGEEEFRQLGSALERHPIFPQRTNVSFVRREGPARLAIRIWERGVGPTFSSGTGSCGAAVAALRTGRVRSPVEVATDTGVQIVEWEPAGTIRLTGQAHFVADIQFYWEG